jgi:hypothetical protein
LATLSVGHCACFVHLRDPDEIPGLRQREPIGLGQHAAEQRHDSERAMGGGLVRQDVAKHLRDRIDICNRRHRCASCVRNEIRALA